MGMGLFLRGAKGKRRVKSLFLVFGVCSEAFAKVARWIIREYFEQEIIRRQIPIDNLWKILHFNFFEFLCGRKRLQTLYLTNEKMSVDINDSVYPQIFPCFL